MQTERETGLLVRQWSDKAAALFFVGLLWLLALAGFSGLLVFLLPAVPSAQALVPSALHSLLSSAAIAAMMDFVVCSPRSLLVKVLELRPLIYLGTISYGIYIWQGIFSGNGPYRQQPGLPQDSVVGVVLAVTVTALSYHFFEKPILRYKDLLGRLSRSEI